MKTLRFRTLGAEPWFKPRYNSKIWIIFVSTQANLLESQGGDTGLFHCPHPHLPKVTRNIITFLQFSQLFIPCPDRSLLLLLLPCLPSGSQPFPLVRTNHSLKPIFLILSHFQPPCMSFSPCPSQAFSLGFVGSWVFWE